MRIRRIRGLPFVRHTGGRLEAGFRGIAGDCVTRAIAIATDRPYREIYDLVNQAARRERPRRGRLRSSAREGVNKATTRRVLAELGWVWHPTMTIGSGTTVHLRPGELPDGRLIVQVSKHLTAVIDGTVYDNHDPCRGGTRCVYGYYTPPAERTSP